MQNNIIEITQRLLRSLDNNYNVIDMPAVVEIISILEKVAITKELLETTRLGKYVNELRKKTSNESLSKRAKELVKKWKNMILPSAETNGQLKQTIQMTTSSSQDSQKRKRFTGDTFDNSLPQTKKPKINGQTSEFEFSDNSNSSFKDVINNSTRSNELKASSNVIVINSDSNSGPFEMNRQDPNIEQQLPKKRGRKKGSKNHKNLVDEAESSFTNKLAVSRGNSKVKTTQELIASLQNKSSTLNLPPLNLKPKEDLNERAAKLTERVSIIDQTLYTNSNRSKQKNRYTSKLSFGERNDRVIESGSVINDKSLNPKEEDEEIIVVDDVDATGEEERDEDDGDVENQEVPPERPPSLTIEEILAKLPPIDKSKLDELDSIEEEEPWCSCYLKENKTDFSVIDADEPETNKYEFIEDGQCRAKTFYANKYRLDDVNECRVNELSGLCKPNVNGNMTVRENDEIIEKDERGLYVNVVPNVYNECKLKGDRPCENFKKYSISENESDAVRTEGREENDLNAFKGFAEWHECVETPSYDGEVLKILPYVVID